MNNIDKTIKTFSRDHHLTIPPYLAVAGNDLTIVIGAKQAIDSELGTNAQALLQSADPTWAITHTMLDRVYEQLEGAFIALFTGSWSSVEIICRATIEAAINVSYVLQTDTPMRVSQYFSHYFDEAGKALNKLEPIEHIADSDRFCSTNNARGLLKQRKQYLETVLRLDGIPVGATGWPKQIAERFRAVGKELEYREIYATLCSQTHNDAESLIDYMITRAFEPSVENIVSSTATELLFWLRYFIHRSSEMYLEVAHLYAQKHGLMEASAMIAMTRQCMQERLGCISAEFISFREGHKALLTPRSYNL
jgi:hypothetical protein